MHNTPCPAPAHAIARRATTFPSSQALDNPTHIIALPAAELNRSPSGIDDSIFLLLLIRLSDGC